MATEIILSWLGIILTIIFGVLSLMKSDKPVSQAENKRGYDRQNASSNTAQNTIGGDISNYNNGSIEINQQMITLHDHSHHQYNYAYPASKTANGDEWLYWIIAIIIAAGTLFLYDNFSGQISIILSILGVVCLCLVFQLVQRYDHVYAFPKGGKVFTFICFGAFFVSLVFFVNPIIAFPEKLASGPGFLSMENFYKLSIMLGAFFALRAVFFTFFSSSLDSIKLFYANMVDKQVSLRLRLPSKYAILLMALALLFCSGFLWFLFPEVIAPLVSTIIHKAIDILAETLSQT